MSTTPIRRALIAVYDKTGIVEFARALVNEFGIEIISTGGTAKHLKDAGIPVTMVETVTGFPEMLDGRVKTLHPKIHAGILADRDNPEHMRQLAEHGIQPIDMVVVNLYPFEKTIADPNCVFEDAIEMIDIGGPCLLRAAAKNHKHVLALHDRQWFPSTLNFLRAPNEDDVEARRQWIADQAAQVFWHVSNYDAKVASWFGTRPELGEYAFGRRALHLEDMAEELRYGENACQNAQVLGLGKAVSRLSCVPPSAGNPPLSYNNFVDADAALGLCAELTRAAFNKEPRASARPVSKSEGSPIVASSPPTISNQLAEPERTMPAWFLTWTTYGTWLPGDDRGFVSRVPQADGTHHIHNEPDSPYDVSLGDVREAAHRRMKGPPVRLTAAQARVVDAAILEASANHSISVIAYSIMEDHVHLLCQAELDGSKLQQLFKGITARRLGQTQNETASPRWWTEGGSKRHIKKGDSPDAVVDYICSQERPLIVRCVDATRNKNADPVSHAFPHVNETQDINTGRAEARGSLAGDASAAVCFIKHTNACGVGIGDDALEAYRTAYLGDPNAAMGGVLAVNFAVTKEFAQVVMETYDRFGKAAGAGGFFVEVWVAPSFDDDAVSLIRGTTEPTAELPIPPKKKWGETVRLLAVGDMAAEPDPKALEYKTIAGGMLVQTPDLLGLNEEQWKVVTKRHPTESEMSDLRLAWLIAKHTKSNAISICKDGMLIGNGAGQMSRVMSCRIATWLAKENGHADKLPGAVAASDAFFPFRDGPGILMDAGVTALIQPGGSKRDDETIAACDERGVAMIFTGTRHFKH